MKFKGDILIADPCCIFTAAEYYSGYSKDLYPNSFIVNTFGAQWDCKMVDTTTLQSIDDILVESGVVGVFLLDEIKRQNPFIAMQIENCKSKTIIIKDFDGEIRPVVRQAEYCWDGYSFYYQPGDKNIEDYIAIVGTGNLNFEISPEYLSEEG